VNRSKHFALKMKGVHAVWSQDLFQKTIAFAGHAHRNQKMPGSESNYLVHITCVSMEIMAAAATDTRMDADLALVCAVLHDVMEDCGVTYDEVAIRFGRLAADGVQALSKNKELPKVSPGYPCSPGKSAWSRWQTAYRISRRPLHTGTGRRLARTGMKPGSFMIYSKKQASFSQPGLLPKLKLMANI